MKYFELLKNCYHLPWSEKDNPNGWIEPTTYCQLKCPGCYRGLDKDGVVHIHTDLEDLKREVDLFLEKRNVQTISIAGGEPLLYPKLEELVSYIRSRGLKTKIFTNGISLNEELLRRLKNSGAIEFIIHIDKFQKREGYKDSDESDLNSLRASYCDLFRKVGGINLGFIQPVSKDNLSDVSTILRFCKNNADIVSAIVFTLYSDINWDDSIKAKINTDIEVLDVVAAIRNQFPYFPSAYLGSTVDKDNPTWLFSVSIGSKDKEFGFFDGKLYQDIELSHYKKTGRYFITKTGNKISIMQFLKLASYSCIRKALRKYLLSILKNPSSIVRDIYLQKLLILRGPKFTNDGGRDLCDGCPDAMFFNDKLVPSCILEEIKIKSIKHE
ncbi:MAG: radical SAM protein [Candidatus Paceibacterota bacterium]|jgi:MoaA/NifB/PqqE/SkfB family radical SAM enzyme